MAVLKGQTKGRGEMYYYPDADGVKDMSAAALYTALNLKAGDILYATGTGLARLEKGTAGQVLTISEAGLPVWSTLQT